MIQDSKYQKLSERMESLGIKENEIFEKFIQGSGKGGQKVNKTSSCVYLKHLPSGIEVKSQATRSREENRFFARRLLCEKLEERVCKEDSAKQKALFKIRRQKQRRTRKQKEKMLGDKKIHSAKKELRRSPLD